MKSIKTNLLGLAFVIISLLSVIFYLYRSGMIDEIILSYQTLNHNYLVFSIILIFCYWFFGAVVLYVIVKHFYKKFKFRHAFEVTMIGQFFNGITPFASGGQPMQLMALKKNGVRMSKGTSSIMIKFVIYQIVLVIYSTILIVLKYEELKSQIDFLDIFVLIGFGLNLIIAISILYLSIAKEGNTAIALKVGKILNRLNIVKDLEKFEEKTLEYLHDFHEYSDVLRNNFKILFISSIFTILQISALLLVPFMIIRSFGLDYDIIMIVASAGFILMVTSLIPIPGGSVGAEGGFIMIMGLFLVGHQLTTALVLWRGITYYLGMFAGAVYYTYHLCKGKRFQAE